MGNLGGFAFCFFLILASARMTINEAAQFRPICLPVSDSEIINRASFTFNGFVDAVISLPIQHVTRSIVF